MSLFPQKADIRQREGDVRLVQKQTFGIGVQSW